MIDMGLSLDAHVARFGKSSTHFEETGVKTTYYDIDGKPLAVGDTVATVDRAPEDSDTGRVIATDPLTIVWRIGVMTPPVAGDLRRVG